MARDTDALKLEKWAASGDVQDPEDGGVNRSTGWDATYSQPGGKLPKREHLNEILRELSAQGVELNTRGLLDWDSSVSYVHPAFVVGSDARLYVSVRDNSNVDPTTDSGEDDWKPLISTTDGTIDEPDDPPDASTTERGVVELATNAETQTGTDATRAVTPTGLASRTATEGRAGLVEKATQAEAAAGTDTSRYMTPDLVKRRIDAIPDASMTVKGLVERATQAEADAGTDTTRYMTPALADRVFSGRTGSTRVVYDSPGSYAWSVPAEANFLFVEAIGGGGSGGRGGSDNNTSSGTYDSGNGGDGGERVWGGVFTLPIHGERVTSIPVVVGAGGVLSSAVSLRSGGDSSFGNAGDVWRVLAQGGSYGVYLGDRDSDGTDGGTTAAGRGGDGGVNHEGGDASNPTVAGGAGTNVTGGDGEDGAGSTTGAGGGGGGGKHGASGGPYSGGAGGDGGDPGGGGGGGGGARHRSSSNPLGGYGGTGGRGEVRIWWWR